jgi:hypothetical protein
VHMQPVSNLELLYDTEYMWWQSLKIYDLDLNSMTSLTCSRNTQSSMIRIGSCTIVLLMAGIAISWRRGVISFMTIIACWSWVPQGYRKSGMIEAGRLPSGVSSMACLACSWNSRSRMVRICSRKIVQSMPVFNYLNLHEVSEMTQTIN